MKDIDGSNIHNNRASTNFQILEVLNFLPLKFGGSTENFRKFQFATRFYRNSSIYILLCLCFFLDIFNRTFMSLLWLWLSWVSSLFCFNNFHRRVGCFASVLLVFFFCIFFFLFTFFYLFIFFLVLNFQVCIKSFLVFLFFNRTKCGKCAFTPQKYTHLRLHLRKCSCFSRHDIADHALWLGVVFKPVKLDEPNILEAWMVLPGCGRWRFLFLCRLLRMIRRGRRRHRLCIISQVRFIGLTFFRNAAFEERTLRHFEHK